LNQTADGGQKMIKRCTWCGRDPDYLAYHDNEWGLPLYDNRRLFEMLILEGAQAGLSWLTILKKRDNYRHAFEQFDPVKIACYDENDVQRLMQNAGIIRNRLKIEAAIKNARGFLQISEEFSSFADYLWRYVEGVPITNAWQKVADIPAHTPISDKLSKDLKNRGFNFVGTTICYAFMQAVGMVNDHTIDCYRYKEIRASGQLRG
jgi:DNA-3-methyladenine glycosylase I